MNKPRRAWQPVLAAALILFAAQSVTAMAKDKGEEKPFEPYSGQPGRDVVWVPTPQILVETMLDMAKVTSKDVVYDLGSGDGRNVIAAAKRGARAVGVEYNPKMVELSRRIAEKEGVGDKATFVQGDMYKADISEATVLALFLLTENLNVLLPKFLDLRPGSRIVVNGFRPSGWEPDETQTAKGECRNWCTAYLYYVPAKVEGTWRLGDATLTIDQSFQHFKGTLSKGGGEPVEITDGRLDGARITFTAGGSRYAGEVDGNAMKGEVKGDASGSWSATRK